MRHSKSRGGFTLIEVLVASVIAVMTVSAAASVVAGTRIARRASDFYYTANHLADHSFAQELGLVEALKSNAGMRVERDRKSDAAWTVYQIESGGRRMAFAFSR